MAVKRDQRLYISDTHGMFTNFHFIDLVVEDIVHVSGMCVTPLISPGNICSHLSSIHSRVK